MSKEKGLAILSKIVGLSQDNVIAWRVLTKLTSIDYGFEYIDLLHKFDIRGELIEVLWYDFAEGDIYCFVEALEMLNYNVLYKEDIVTRAKEKGILEDETSVYEESITNEINSYKIR